MSNTKVVKAGIMPGQIREFGVEVGSSVAALLALAELNPAGYEVKVDGVTVTDFNTPITASTNLVLLAKQVKGNSGAKTVKAGIMPGQIREFGVEIGSTVSALLALAELNPAGYEVKVDGVTVTDFNTQITASTNLVLLAKQVKGNK